MFYIIVGIFAKIRVWMLPSDFSFVFNSYILLTGLFYSLKRFNEQSPEPASGQRRVVLYPALITIRKTNKRCREHHSEVSAALRVGSAPCQRANTGGDSHASQGIKQRAARLNFSSCSMTDVNVDKDLKAFTVITVCTDRKRHDFHLLLVKVGNAG